MMFQKYRAIFLSGVLCVLAGCAASKVTKNGEIIPLLNGNGSVALLPSVPEAPSSKFIGRGRSEYRVEDPAGTILSHYTATPQMLTPPGHVIVRRAPGSRVFLAGSADGTEDLNVDNFYLVEVENPSMPGGLSRIVAGVVGMVFWGKIPLENRFNSFSIPAGAVDITDLIPPCTAREVSVVAMDHGVIASSGPVYLVVAPKAVDPMLNYCEQASCAGKFSSSGR